MSLNLIAVQDQITAKLNELAQDVYEGTVPEDVKLKFSASGILLPYIVVNYTDMYNSTGASGILSTRYDLKVSYADVSCVAPTERAARQVAGLVRDKLLGFIPTDAGELQIDGGSKYTMFDAKPNRYVSELSFAFAVNTVW
jgi:hypothetical protein